MGRKPRLNMAKNYHIVNRGIERINLYRSGKEKEKFIGLLQQSAEAKAPTERSKKNC